MDRDYVVTVSTRLGCVGSKIPIPELIRPEPAKIMTGDTAQYANRQAIHGSPVTNR